MWDELYHNLKSSSLIALFQSHSIYSINHPTCEYFGQLWKHMWYKIDIYQIIIIFSNENEVNNNSRSIPKPANPTRQYFDPPISKPHGAFDSKKQQTYRAITGWKPRATREVIIAGQSFELIVRFRYDSVPIPWCVAMPLAAPNNMWTSRSWWDRRDYYAPLHHERKACVGQGRRAMWTRGGTRDRDKSRKRPRPRGEREG